MVSEDFVSYSILKWLKARDWTVLQYHPPGGGAAYPVRFSNGGIIYPDITAYKARELLVLENKARFSQKDVKKLRRLVADSGACKCVRDYARAKALARPRRVPHNARIRVGHGYGGKSRNPFADVELFRVREDGS